MESISFKQYAARFNYLRKYQSDRALIYSRYLLDFKQARFKRKWKRITNATHRARVHLYKPKISLDWQGLPLDLIKLINTFVPPNITTVMEFDARWDKMCGLHPDHR